MPILSAEVRYSPHLVVDDKNTNADEYLGVYFLPGSSIIKVNEEAVFNLCLMYYPEVNYSKLVACAKFTIK